MPFFTISSLNSKNYLRNINSMPPVIFRVCLKLCRALQAEAVAGTEGVFAKFHRCSSCENIMGYRL